jgi:hypothetical protein
MPEDTVGQSTEDVVEDQQRAWNVILSVQDAAQSMLMEKAAGNRKESPTMTT